MIVNFQIDLQMQQAFHIQGEQRSRTRAQRPLIKTPDGFAFIPASTLKGCLRYELEKVLGYGSNVAPNPEQLAQPLPSDPPPSLIERIFGTAWIESCLYFEDLQIPPAQKIPALQRTHTRISVGINRRRGVARDHNLFSTEVGMPLYFSGILSADLRRLDEQDWVSAVSLLEGGLRLIERIGSGRSRGLGWCQVYVQEDSGYSREEKKAAFQQLLPLQAKG